ncbi:hypothetical protein C6499_21910 [Candidatus Poribacteria bacterium]|nr:MAG: hypothetical protein C6499_21910 [Candidatus Poribacteria bacterium]
MSNQFQSSWDAVRGYSVVLLALAFLLTTLGTEGSITTALGLIFISSAWIGFSILPLFGENRTTFVFVASVILIAAGIGIGGLGIATLLEVLFSENKMSVANNWGLGVVSVLANLAVLIWGIVILKVSPDTPSLRAGVVSLAMASGYPIGAGVFSIILSIGQDDLQIFTYAVQAMAVQAMTAILSGGAIIAWTLAITRKVVHGKVRFVVPVLVICGIGVIGVGISHIIDAV